MDMNTAQASPTTEIDADPNAVNPRYAGDVTAQYREATKPHRPDTWHGDHRQRRLHRGRTGPDLVVLHP